MSYEKVKAYFESLDALRYIRVIDQSSATVEEAAAAIGCVPAQIAKTMSFLVGDTVILVVTCGDTKIDNAKFKAFFKTKAKMIPFTDVEQLVGHAPGGVCPFAANEGVQTYLDVSLKRFDIIYPAAGDSHSIGEMTPDELDHFAKSLGWIDVCKPMG